MSFNNLKTVKKYVINCNSNIIKPDKVSSFVSRNSNSNESVKSIGTNTTESTKTKMNSLQKEKKKIQLRTLSNQREIKPVKLIAGMYNEKNLRDRYRETHYYYPISNFQNSLNEELSRICTSYGGVSNRRKFLNKSNPAIFTISNSYDLYYKYRLINRGNLSLPKRPKLKPLISVGNNKLDRLGTRIFDLNKLKRLREMGY